MPKPKFIEILKNKNKIYYLWTVYQKNKFKGIEVLDDIKYVKYKLLAVKFTKKIKQWELHFK